MNAQLISLVVDFGGGGLIEADAHVHGIYENEGDGGTESFEVRGDDVQVLWQQTGALS